jgi:DNA-binding NtrC family response regulator
MQPTILVIDDDVGVANAIRKFLTICGNKCVLVTSFKEAIEVFGDAVFLKLPIHGILTDVNLLDGKGYNLIDLCRYHYPDVPLAMMTAYVDENLADLAMIKKIPVLQKPFRLAQLTEWLKIPLAYATLHSEKISEEADSWQHEFRST